MRLSVLLSLILLAGCAELNNPGFDDRGGYDYRRYDQRYDHRRNDYYYDRQREHDRERRQELKRESRALESERRRLEAERQALERQRQEEARRTQERHNQRQRPERCPAGFRPSEDKCTPRERQRGCRDMRLPGGLGCVSR